MPAVDWAQPWNAPWRVPGESVAGAAERGVPLHDALNAQAPAPVRFVPQESLPPDTAYERFIFDTRQCPVRPACTTSSTAWCGIASPRQKLR
jgi:hypothetical protein